MKIPVMMAMIWFFLGFWTLGNAQSEPEEVCLKEKKPGGSILIDCRRKKFPLQAEARIHCFSAKKNDYEIILPEDLKAYDILEKGQKGCLPSVKSKNPPPPRGLSETNPTPSPKEKP